MKNSEITDLLTFLSDVYPSFKFPLKTAEETTRMVKSWSFLLGEIELKEAMPTIKQLLLEKKDFVPDAGQIARKILDNRKPERLSPEEAWLFAQSISGDYNKSYFKSILENTPELVKQAVRLSGGYESVYYNDNSYDKSRFLKIYESLLERDDLQDIKQVAGVEDRTQIEATQVSTDDITDGLKQIGKEMK